MYSKSTSSTKRRPSNNSRSNIDIVTGKKLVSIYLEPSRLVDFDSIDDEWKAYHLYEPAAVVKEEKGIFTIKTLDGKVLRSNGGLVINDVDDGGVEDILKLREFSEMSLMNTLRSRYQRDELYTFVGSILISINPYKRLKDLYSESTMMEYHSRNVRIVYLALSNGKNY